MSEIFKIEKWSILEGENKVRFYYTCSQYGAFSEDIIFPETVDLKMDEIDPVLENLLNVAAVYIGISYYKLAAASHIQLSFPVTDSSKSSIMKLYQDGLGEFYVRNNLDFPPNISCGFLNEPLVADTSFEEEEPDQKAVLAFGGGKDSHVSMHILEDLEIPFTPVSVVLSDKVKETLTRLAGRDLTFIERKLDHRLIELGKRGEGYNGHIPITAINSIILSVYAYLMGYQWVVFSNEHGSSIPTIMHEGRAVNHQYSKSLEFENFFIQMLRGIAGSKISYFSILRPFSELWIATYLARYAAEAQKTFSSCNRNFVFEGENKLPEGKRWCGKCSKCVYTAIILAPHLTKQEFLDIFGIDILDELSNLQTVKNLCGIGEDKPWECVGDVTDTAASLFNLITLSDWREAALVTALSDEIEARYGAGTLTNRFVEQLKPAEQHNLPPEFHILLTMAI